MFPEDLGSTEGEATFGRQLVILIIAWVVITVAIAIVLILLSPWLTTSF